MTYNQAMAILYTAAVQNGAKLRLINKDITELTDIYQKLKANGNTRSNT